MKYHIQIPATWNIHLKLVGLGFWIPGLQRGLQREIYQQMDHLWKVIFVRCFLLPNFWYTSHKQTKMDCNCFTASPLRFGPKMPCTSIPNCSASMASRFPFDAKKMLAPKTEKMNEVDLSSTPLHDNLWHTDIFPYSSTSLQTEKMLSSTILPSISSFWLSVHFWQLVDFNTALSKWVRRTCRFSKHPRFWANYQNS